MLSSTLESLLCSDLRFHDYWTVTTLLLLLPTSMKVLQAAENFRPLLAPRWPYTYLILGGKKFAFAQDTHTGTISSSSPSSSLRELEAGSRPSAVFEFLNFPDSGEAARRRSQRHVTRCDQRMTRRSREFPLALLRRNRAVKELIFLEEEDQFSRFLNYFIRGIEGDELKVCLRKSKSIGREKTVGRKVTDAILLADVAAGRLARWRLRVFAEIFRD